MGMISEDAVRDPAKPVCIVHQVRVRPECIQAYRAYVREHYLVPANGEPGCTLYDLWQDVRDPCLFIVVEQWATLAALETHMQKPYVLGGLAQASAMQEGPMQSWFLSSTLAG